jgi:ketosteroid isomerase-like protein
MTELGQPASQNITVAQALYAAFQRGDIHAILTTLHPEVEWGEPENPFNSCAGTGVGTPDS